MALGFVRRFTSDRLGLVGGASLTLGCGASQAGRCSTELSMGHGAQCSASKVAVPF